MSSSRAARWFCDGRAFERPSLYGEGLLTMTYIIQPGETNRRDQLGGKAGALAALHQTGLSIPAWIALSPEAFYANLSEAQQNRLASAASTEVLGWLSNLSLSQAVQDELKQALAKLCPDGETVAVRSSALDEDGLQHSFAGQLDSFLEVPIPEVAAKVMAVWRSGYSERILAYRREHGLSSMSQPPAVLIQRMVKADRSGVAFSADPVTGRRDVAVVAAVQGLGLALVSGEVDADTYRVDRQGQIIDRQIVAKQMSEPVLADLQIQAVAALVRRVEQFFGRPQDIEWAIEEGHLYLLQARPITTLPDDASKTPEVPETSRVFNPPPGGLLNLWDNSNIAESYPGLTTPLTFSFARRAYEEVYRQFCRLMGVPGETVATHAPTFRRMLGFIQGRIYYNLLSWYRVLALLPGYQLNRRFMEQMMGVKESLPDELLEQQASPGRAARLRDALYLVRTLVGLIVNYFLLPRRVAAFYERLNHALGPGRPDLSQRRPDELVAYYRRLEDQLLTRWDAPLVNDFFAMIFYGALRKLTEKWCGDTNGTLQNELLAETGEMISAEPARRMRQMAHLVAAQPALATLLHEGSLPEILAHLPDYPEFFGLYQAYLDKFGDRCLEELKLETPTLHDDPLLLLRSIGQLAGAQLPLDRPGQAITNYQSPAEARIRSALASNPLRRLIFNWVLKNARILIRNRENLRFERTRLFGRARLIFLELGCKFQAQGFLADARDIFYLTVEEVLSLVEGTAVTTDFKSLVTLRRAEFEAYQNQPFPPNRFETRGIPYQGLEFGVHIQNPKSEIVNLKSLRGLGCSPGVVRGRVRIVTDPKTAQLQPGEILVAERTDPGWIMLFPMAAGLLVEYGSLLSHSAIVSRELGLPAIVSLTGVTHWLKDGEWVEFDGSTGIVTRMESLDV